MADLLTTATLAKWTQNDPDEVAADPFAVDLIDKVSRLVQFLGGHPDWELELGDDRVPIDVEMIVLQVCKRSYENPTQIVQEGNVGPLGGDRHLDDYALFMSFTDAERAAIVKYNPDGDPDPVDGAGEVFVLSTTRGDETTLPQTSPLYVPDNGQIGLDPGDNAYPSWDIPLFNPGDPGDDALYED